MGFSILNLAIQENNMIIAIYILTGLFILLFGFMCYVAHTERNEQRERMEKDTRSIELTSSGDDESDSEDYHYAKSVEVSSVDTIIHKDDETLNRNRN